MKTKVVTLLSLKDLDRLGYKQRLDQSGWYLGNSKHPTHEISGHKYGHLLGNHFSLLGLKDNKVLLQDMFGNEMYVPASLVKTKIKKMKSKKIIFRDEVVNYFGYGFEFPCVMRNMGTVEAIKIAKWILKVSK